MIQDMEMKVNVPRWTVQARQTAGAELLSSASAAPASLRWAHFLRLCAHLDCTPDIWALHDWSAWLTPFSRKGGRRFETTFFLCCLREPPPVFPDLVEVVDCQNYVSSLRVSSNREARTGARPRRCAYARGEFIRWPERRGEDAPGPGAEAYFPSKHMSVPALLVGTRALSRRRTLAATPSLRRRLGARPKWGLQSYPDSCSFSFESAESCSAVVLEIGKA
ncbi:hypothetical protein CB1_000128002 [Camelus ferus]|nr:hypothetical protein CB1_000128002 [Camelus ferus]